MLSPGLGIHVLHTSGCDKFKQPGVTYVLCRPQMYMCELDMVELLKGALPFASNLVCSPKYKAKVTACMCAYSRPS